MALDGDAENPVNVSEHTPLLEANDPDHQPGQDDYRHKHKRAGWYAWRVLWAIVAAFILGIFIKGWIDAGGNTDVGSTRFPQDLTSSLTMVSCTV